MPQAPATITKDKRQLPALTLPGRAPDAPQIGNSIESRIRQARAGAKFEKGVLIARPDEAELKGA